jgi:hypothetical protein
LAIWLFGYLAILRGGFNWDRLQQYIVGFQQAIKTVAVKKQICLFLQKNLVMRWQASGSKSDRQQHQKILTLAQARKIDVILVTELTRWGRSTLDLFHTLNDLQAWRVRLLTQTGLQFDLATPQGKIIATLMAGLAELSMICCVNQFERVSKQHKHAEWCLVVAVGNE